MDNEYPLDISEIKQVIGTADVVEINEELNQLANEVKDLEGNTPLPPVDEKTGKEVLG